jgi:hypothetical protein
MSKKPRRRAVFTGRSPINILVQDPLGRRVGFEPGTDAAVNEIGSGASYSGPGSAPQVIEILPDEVLPGQYSISGVGTGTGGCTIDVRIFSEDDSGDVFEKTLATGIASAGQPLLPIPPIDCILSTLYLRMDRVGGNLVLLSPPWATNVVVEWSSNLLAGSWSLFPQPINPTNGLVLTNLSDGTKFFRLRAQ